MEHGHGTWTPISQFHNGISVAPSRDDTELVDLTSGPETGGLVPAKSGNPPPPTATMSSRPEESVVGPHPVVVATTGGSDNLGSDISTKSGPLSTAPPPPGAGVILPIKKVRKPRQRNNPPLMAATGPSSDYLGSNISAKAGPSSSAPPGTGVTLLIKKIRKPRQRKNPPLMAATGPSSENLASNIDAQAGPSSSSAAPSAGAGPSLPKAKRVRGPGPRRRKNPIPFVDPIADFITELYGPGPASTNGEVPEISQPPNMEPSSSHVKKIEMQKENNKTPTPLPSTSRAPTLAAKSQKRRAPVPKSPGSGGEGPSGGAGGSPVLVVKLKRARRSLTLISPLPADKGNRVSGSSGNASGDDDSDDEVPVTPRRRSSAKKGNVIITSDDEITPPTTEESEKKRAKVLKKRLRRYAEKKKTDMDIALERLQKKVEAKKRKQAENMGNKASSSPRDESKEGSGDDTGESDDDDSDDSESVSGSSSCPGLRDDEVSSSAASDSSVTSDAETYEESEKKKPKVLKRGLRRYTEKKKTEKDLALERLQKKMEARKLKQAEKKAKASSEPRREEEAREESGNETGESDASSDYSDSGSSPCPVVPDDEVSSSAESDNSAPIAAETDEEPDLGSGSEGEKDLVQEEPEDEEEKSDRTSSSSEDETPDDGQNDIRCLLCKELGSRDFEERAHQGGISWCKCGECEIFADDVGDYDLVCCKEMRTVRAFLKEELEDDVCITKHPRFKTDVLENGGYARAMSKHYSFGLRTGGGAAAYYEYSCANRKHSDRMYDLAKENFRRSGRNEKYWKSLSSFKYWIYDRLNPQEGQKVVLPACVLSTVRQVFNVPRSFYRPFKASTKCPVGLHCESTFDDTPTQGYPPQ